MRYSVLPGTAGAVGANRTMNDTMILLTSIANTIEAAFYLFIIWTRLVRNDRRDLPIFSTVSREGNIPTLVSRCAASRAQNA